MIKTEEEGGCGGEQSKKSKEQKNEDITYAGNQLIMFLSLGV